MQGKMGERLRLRLRGFAETFNPLFLANQHWNAPIGKASRVCTEGLAK